MRRIRLAKGRPYFPFSKGYDYAMSYILFSLLRSTVVWSPAALCCQCWRTIVKLKWAAHIFTAALRILVSPLDSNKAVGVLDHRKSRIVSRSQTVLC